MTPWSVRPVRWSMKPESVVRIDVGHSSSDRRDEERPIPIEDVNAILPQVSFSHEGGAEPHPHITADGICSVIVGLNVKLERRDGFHDDYVAGCLVCIDVCTYDLL